MKWRTLKIIALVALANILVFGSCTYLVFYSPFSWVSRSMDLVIDNQSDQNLTIYDDGILLGNVGPRQSITTEESVDKGRYTITALNIEGEVVFAKRFTHVTLIHLDTWDRKAVIPSHIPRRGAIFVELVIENKSDMILAILVEGKLVGDASPGESVTEGNLPNPYLPASEEIRYHVVANNKQGQEVFGESLKLSKLEIIDFDTLKAVIEPFYKDIIFQNKTKSVVIVFVNFFRVGEIKPGETVKKNVPIYSDFVRITAEDAQGRIVYYNYRHYVSWEFRDKKWEEVIPPYGD